MSTVITVETLFGASNTDILDVLNGEGEAAAAAALAAASANAKPMPAIHANNKVKPADPAAPMGIDALFADLTLNEKDTKDMEEPASNKFIEFLDDRVICSQPEHPSN